MDGFILSHTMAQVEIPTQEQIDRFLPPASIPQRLDKAAHTLGQMETPHQSVVHRSQHHQAMLGARQVYREIQDSFAEIFGRRPADPLISYRAEDAETLIVSMGTLGVTAERVVDQLRDQGQAVGSVRVRMFRPLPDTELCQLFGGKKRIAVLDRDISIGFGGALWGEVRNFADRDSIVQGYMIGVGGGDVRPEHLLNLLAELEQSEESAAPKIVEVA
jgi:pyruvate/2-oxoacid:ferredoxin oxidoreductase alpha subunit